MKETTRFLGLDCVSLANESVSLLVTQSVGPRIISLRVAGGENVLAELPEMTIPCPGAGALQVWGGHRLWHAPEVAARTYLPDDEPVTIASGPDSVVATQRGADRSGLQKSLSIHLPDDSATVVVDHTLTSHSLWPVTCAPWAITQFQPGGVAILPQPTEPADPDGLQPNRHVALWTYTDIGSPHIGWGNEFIMVRADMKEGALKIGFANPRGWLAYYRQETLFVKRATYDAEAPYYDRGSSSQCYCRDWFLELETLGPRTTIAPGASATHREVWELYTGIDMTLTEEGIGEIVRDLGLAEGSPYLSTSP